MSTRVSQISDTHVGCTKSWFAGNLGAIAADIRAQGADLVVNTGDISINGADDRDDLVAAKRIHDVLGVPYRVIPGNHDIGDTQAIARHQPINAERRARYCEVFGADWWQMDVPGWRLIGINAQLLGADLEAAADQLAFLRDCRTTSTDRALALFVHKPLFDRAPDETARHGYFIGPADRDDVRDAIGDRLRVVASGHIHQFRDQTVDGIRHVWAPATSFYLPPAYQTGYGERTVGYVAHEFRADGSHDCTLRARAGAAMLSLEDFPEAYGDLRQIQAKFRAYAGETASA